MERSTFIARLLGPFFLVSGLGMLLNRSVYQVLITEALLSPALLYLSGLLALSAGLAIVNLHNTWTGGWRVVVTVIGWLMLVGGTIRMLVPQWAMSVGTAVYASSAAMIVSAVVTLAVGGFLTFKGYR